MGADLQECTHADTADKFTISCIGAFRFERPVDGSSSTADTLVATPALQHYNVNACQGQFTVMAQAREESAASNEEGDATSTAGGSRAVFGGFGCRGAAHVVAGVPHIARRLRVEWLSPALLVR